MLDAESDRYSLTMRMFELSHRFPPTKRLTAVAGEIMDDAALRLNQSLHLAILYGDDILVIAQKIVSKAEGQLVSLGDINPSDRAKELAAEVNKDPRLVELILSESTEVIRHRKDVLIPSGCYRTIT